MASKLTAIRNVSFTHIHKRHWKGLFYSWGLRKRVKVYLRLIYVKMRLNTWKWTLLVVWEVPCCSVWPPQGRFSTIGQSWTNQLWSWSHLNIKKLRFVNNQEKGNVILTNNSKWKFPLEPFPCFLLFLPTSLSPKNKVTKYLIFGNFKWN